MTFIALLVFILVIMNPT